MKIATIIARVFLGLIFVVFGSNQFLNFMPLPPMPHPGDDFLRIMAETHFLYVVAACQVIGGALLLIGRFLPLGLTLLVPVVVNIVCFHAFMAPAGLPMAGFVAVVTLFLLWRYRTNFAGLLQSGQLAPKADEGAKSGSQSASTLDVG